MTPGHERLLYAVFFLAGMPALMYQVIWQRVLTLYFGVDIYSTSITVATFMLGLGIGSLVGGWLADRTARPATLYAACELLMGAFGFLSLWAFERVGRALGGSPLAVLIPVDFALLLVPTTLMGMTLPLMCQSIRATDTRVGQHFSTLYAVNTLGAAAGALISSYALIGWLGLAGATHVAAMTNVALGGVVVWAVRRQPGREGRPSAVPGAAVVPSSADRSWSLVLTCSFLSGFVALGYELVWYRLLTSLLHGTVYVFGTILCVLLSGIAAGSWCGRRWADGGNALQRFGVAQLGASVYVLGFAVALGYFSGVPGLRHLVGATALTTFHPAPELLSGPVSLRALYSLADILLWAGAWLAVPTFLMGFGFPSLIRAGTASVTRLGRSVGSVYFANIVGSTAGSLVVGFVGIHYLGSETTLRILVIAGCGTAALAVGSGSGAAAVRRRAQGWRAAAILAALAAAALFPGPMRLMRAVHYADFDQVEFAGEEDRTGVVVLRRQTSVITFPEERTILGARRLLIDGAAHGGFWPDEPEVVLDPAVRLALSAHRRPRRVLSIGLGDGKMCAAAAEWPGVQEVMVIELNGALTRMLGKMSQGRMLEQSGKLRVITDDGRRWLQANPGERFDVILMWPLHAAHAYSGNLYSLEFFELLAAHLAPGGLVFGRSVDMFSTARTIAATFPYVVRIGRAAYVAGFEPFRFDPAALGMTPAQVLAELEADRGLIVAHTRTAAVNRDFRPNSEYYLTYPYRAALQTWGGSLPGYGVAGAPGLTAWVKGGG